MADIVPRLRGRMDRTLTFYRMGRLLAAPDRDYNASKQESVREVTAGPRPALIIDNQVRAAVSRSTATRVITAMPTIEI